MEEPGGRGPRKLDEPPQRSVAARWRGLLAALGGLIVLAAVAVVLLDQGGSTPPPRRELAPLKGAQPEHKPLIFDLGYLALDPAHQANAVSQVKALGADAVRVVMPWQNVSPAAQRPANFRASDPADPNYDFGPYDTLLRGIRADGLKIVLTPTGPFPKWVSQSGQSQLADPRPGAFGDFVSALAARYSGKFRSGGKTLPRVDLWSVWNEPNLAIFLKPQFRDGKPYSPSLYRRLYFAAQTAIEAKDPSAAMLIGETAPTGGTDSVDPVPFARGVLCLDSAGDRSPGCGAQRIHAVGWATHPYSGGGAPFDPATSPDYVTMSSLGALEGVLARSASLRTSPPRGLPVYITEFGVQSVPNTTIGVSLQKQADYLSIAERIAYADPQVASFAQYLLQDDPPSSALGFDSGLRLYGGVKKPSYDSFRTPLAVQKAGQRAMLWALVQAARGPTRVRIRYEDPGAEPRIVRTARTDAAGTASVDADFAQGRRWQVVWTDPASGRTHRGPWTAAYPFGLPAAPGAPPLGG